MNLVNSETEPNHVTLHTLELEPCWVRALVSHRADLDLGSSDLQESCLCTQEQGKVPGLDPPQCLPQ